jgi:hypothetical protein
LIRSWFAFGKGKHGKKTDTIPDFENQFAKICKTDSLTHARLAWRASGFAKFLSPLPKRLKSHLIFYPCLSGFIRGSTLARRPGAPYAWRSQTMNNPFCALQGRLP